VTPLKSTYVCFCRQGVKATEFLLLPYASYPIAIIQFTSGQLFQLEDYWTIAVGAAGEKDILATSRHAIHRSLYICPGPATKSFRHVPGLIKISNELIPYLKVGALCPYGRIGCVFCDKFLIEDFFQNSDFNSMFSYGWSA
jgi:hypothetical protein